MASTKPILLYSTNTMLAFDINEEYYRQEHYVWCNPYFDASSVPTGTPLAPSSTPADIYYALSREVQGADRHNVMIERNRNGLRYGADAKEKAGVITAEQKQKIIGLIDNAPLKLFEPVLYVMPFALIAKRVKTVPAEDRANPLHDEYIIENLPRNCFGLIKLPM
jgi:hypothetical protein